MKPDWLINKTFYLQALAGALIDGLSDDIVERSTLYKQDLKQSAKNFLTKLIKVEGAVFGATTPGDDSLLVSDQMIQSYRTMERLAGVAFQVGMLPTEQGLAFNEELTALLAKYDVEPELTPA